MTTSEPTPSTVTPTTTDARVSPRTHSSGNLRETGKLVDSRISGSRGLQTRYLSNESQGRADLAALRKAVNLAPGELPEIWELTQVSVPDTADDAPTREEIAVHTAMTLYAVHQQSRTEPVFKRGRGLGHAARDLVGRDEENPSARARFNALVTSASISELRHHLRSFVSQLRARGIALDYAMLADDIVRFQTPGGARSVRLRWARQYASFPVSADAALDTNPNPATQNSEN